MVCNICGDKPVFPLLKFAFFEIFPAHGLFFRGGSNMVAFRVKVDGTWQPKFQRRLAVSCNRPTALWASQPSFLSCSHLFLFCPPLLSLFPIFLLVFHLFHSFPFSLLFFLPFFHIFPKFFFTFSHFPLFPTFSGQSDGSLRNSLANFVPREAPPTSERDTLWEKIFAHFSALLGAFKKRVLNV